jgi:hypothetical protein
MDFEVGFVDVPALARTASDDRTLARVRLANPEMKDRALLRLYLNRVPSMAYRDSCIFHGKEGCTLDRSMRADVCNTYYCGGLSSAPI